MDRREFLKKGFFATAAFGSVLSCCTAMAKTHSPKKPLNFVFFLVDDLGWADLGCYGSTFNETPAIDKLASQGMLFTDAYAANPVCSPTRASIMTGKDPARVGITQWIGGPQSPSPYVQSLPLEEVTLAEAFKEQGYMTGFFGKWHLTNKGLHGGHNPSDQGFDYDVTYHWKGGKKSFHAPYGDGIYGLNPKFDNEYLTDRNTDDAIDFLRTTGDKPFMLYVAHYAVHTPIEAKEDLIAKYEAKRKRLGLPAEEKEVSYPVGEGFTGMEDQINPIYAAMLESVDYSIAKIMDKLQEQGLTENTAIIFMSDNGGLSTWPWKPTPTSNMPLREGKGWLYEGGIRVPMIVKWPGQIKPGSKCSWPVISNDFYPTMLEMAGYHLKPQQHMDGQSLVPLLKGKKSIKRDTLYWHYPHHHAYGNLPSGAVRQGNYKFIEYYELGYCQLFNLKDDVGEMNDLSEKMTGKTAQMRAMLHQRIKNLDAYLPSKEDYDKMWKDLEAGTYFPWFNFKRKRNDIFNGPDSVIEKSRPKEKR